MERGQNLPLPDGLLINGRGWNGYTFNVEPGRCPKNNFISHPKKQLLMFELINYILVYMNDHNSICVPSMQARHIDLGYQM